MPDEILLYSFLSAVIIQLGYLSCLAVGFFGYTKVSTDQVPVSLIICGHNEASNFKKLIPLLRAQDHKQFEIILINDRSSDGTFELMENAKSLTNKIKTIHIKQTPPHVNPKKFAIEQGVKAANYDHLVFTDADCVPNSIHWLSQMAKGFGRKDLLLGYSAYRKESGFLNYFVRYETLWTAVQYIGFALIGKPYMGVGRNLGYTKSLFMDKKGFTGYRHITGGDDDLFVNKNARKNNTNVLLGAVAMTISEPKKTVSDFLRQKLRHLAAGKSYSIQSKLLLSIWTSSHLLFWALFITLLMLRIEVYILVISFLIRTLWLHITFKLACKKLGERFELWGLVILDCIFVFYYLLVGVAALFTKRVKWI